MKFAVYVAADPGTVIWCDCPPPSDQLVQTYWHPEPHEIGVAAIVWVEPTVHVKV